MKLASLLIVTTVLSISVERKLICLHDIFKHGARTPLNSEDGVVDERVYKYTKSIEVKTFNQLLPEGRHGHYLLEKPCLHQVLEITLWGNSG